MFKGRALEKLITVYKQLKEAVVGGKVVCQIELKWSYITKLKAFCGSTTL